jgi:uncharacterized protein (DUF1697 family)
VKSYVALLRAVNVSGQNKLPMASLRTVLLDAGYPEVATYLQSGNVVLRAASTPEAKLAAGLEREIRKAFGLTVTVLVRTGDQVRQVQAGNPFLRPGADPASLHVTFLASKPSAARVEQLEPKLAGPDEAIVRGREIYLSCPGGYGRTKLTNAFFERQLDVRATTRNWKTVTTLRELARA